MDVKINTSSKSINDTGSKNNTSYWRGHNYYYCVTFSNRTMQYGAEVWAKKKQEKEKAHLTEMCTRRRMCGVMRKDSMTNE